MLDWSKAMASFRYGIDGRPGELEEEQLLLAVGADQPVDVELA
jgi:hypothetical protein